jgi:hypothetical protein
MLSCGLVVLLVLAMTSTCSVLYLLNGYAATTLYGAYLIYDTQ